MKTTAKKSTTKTGKIGRGTGFRKTSGTIRTREEVIQSSKTGKYK